MAMKDLDKIITDAEKELGKELSDRFNKAVQARDVQAKADKETKSSDKKCPKDVQAVFDAALAAEMTKVQRDYKDVKYSPDMSTKMKGTQWIATVKTDVSFVREKKGGASHKVSEGETVFAIAEKYYGSGAYWPAIEDANPFIVSKGNFIVCSMGLKIPSIEVVKNMALVDSIASPKVSKEADKPAKVVWQPDWEMEVSVKQNRATVKLPGLTVELEIQMKGKATVKGMGPVPAGFNVRSGEAEVKAAWKSLEGSVKFDINKGLTEIGVSSQFCDGKAAISVTKDGTFKASIESPPKKFTVGGRDCEATLTIEIAAKLIPDPDLKAPVTSSIGDRVKEWAQENRTAILVTTAVVIVVVGGAAIIASGGTATPGVVAFAEASAVAMPGILAIAR